MQFLSSLDLIKVVAYFENYPWIVTKTIVFQERELPTPFGNEVMSNL